MTYNMFGGTLNLALSIYLRNKRILSVTTRRVFSQTIVSLTDT